jgi:hypothetical protein
VLTSFPRSRSRINRTRRRVILESRLLTGLLLRPFPFENYDRRFFQRPFKANASRWFQAVLLTVNRIELVLRQERNVLASLFSRLRAARENARVQTSDICRAGIILIKEDAPLPSAVPMERGAFLPGWRIVKNLDRQALTREIVGASLKFSYLAGEIRATVLWCRDLGALRRAAKCVLAKQEEQNFRFNSVEFTKVVSRWFLGVPVMSVTAHSRCIQRGCGLSAPRILS